MGFKLSFQRLLLGAALALSVACDNAKPLIDAADVSVLKLTSINPIVLVEGSNLSWFESLYIEDSNGNVISATIDQKADGMMNITPSSPLVVGQSYRLILDAGLKVPFRSELITLDSIASPSVTLSTPPLIANNQFLNANGSCNVLYASIRLTVTNNSDMTTVWADTSCAANSTWSYNLYTMGVSDGNVTVSVQYTGAISAPIDSRTSSKDTVLPVLTYVSGLPTEASRSNMVNVSAVFDYSDVHAGEILYTIGTSGCGTTSSWATSGGTTALPTELLPGADGSIVFCAQAVDSHGNASAWQMRSWTRDTVAPTFLAGDPLSIDDNNATSPAGFSWEFTGLTARGSLDIDESYVTYSLFDGSTCGSPNVGIGSGSMVPAFSVPFNFDNQSTVGTRAIAVHLVDQAGNSTCVSTSVYVDRFTPIASQFYVNGGYVNGPLAAISYNVTGIDNQGDLNAQIYANPTCSGVPITSPTYIYSGTPLASAFTHGLTDQSVVQHYVRINDPSGRYSCTPSSNAFRFTLEVLPLYGVSTLFNEWVKKSNPSQECDPATPADCEWAGQFRKVETGESSCVGLAIGELPVGDDMFNWTCEEISGRAIFIGKLRAAKRLNDLFFDNAGTYNWKSKSVSLSGTVTGASTSSLVPVYGGSIFEISVSAGSRFYLNSEGATYVVPDFIWMPTGGITIDAKKVSLVGQDNVSDIRLIGDTLQVDGGNYSVVRLTSNAVFSHVDINMDNANPATNSYAIDGDGAHFATIRSKRIFGWGNGIRLNNSHGAEVSGLSIQGNNVATTIGVNVTSSNHVKLSKIHSELYASGIKVVTASNLSAHNLSASENTAEGMNFTTLSNSKLSALRAFNNNVGAGVTVGGTSMGVIIQNVLSSGNGTTGGGKGLVLNTCSGCIVQNVLTAHHYTHGTTVSGSNNIVMNVTSIRDQSYGMLFNSSNLVASRLASFQSGTYQFGIQTYDPTIYSPIIAYGVSPMFTLSGGAAVTPTLDWVAPSVPATDGPTSVSVYSGYMFFLDSYPANWMSTFGKNVGSGTCTAGTCYRNTWIPMSTDTILLGNGPYPAAGTPVSAAVATCPNYLNGNETITAQGQTYLKNAMEVINPKFLVYGETGDHDGLCENNETCMAMPNLGIYQGHGPIQYCNFQSGTVSGVNMYGFTQNGLGTVGEIVATESP